jgi:putative transposase
VHEHKDNLHLMRWLDEPQTRCPFYGVRRMTAWLRQQGYPVNEKRVRRLWRQLGLMAVYPKPHVSPRVLGGSGIPTDSPG